MGHPPPPLSNYSGLIRSTLSKNTINNMHFGMHSSPKEYWALKLIISMHLDIMSKVSGADQNNFLKRRCVCL